MAILIFEIIWALDYDGEVVQSVDMIAEAPGPIASFGEDEAGELYVVDFDGDIWQFVPTSATNSDPPNETPDAYALHQNYPNPFNPETSISFETPVDGPVRLKIYDVLGREIKKLADRPYSAGYHRISWDGRREDGSLAANGLYLYVLEASSVRKSRTMLLMK